MKPLSLQWRHNGHDSVSNHQPHDCLLNRLFRRKSKKTSKLRITGLCAGNSPGTGDFPAQMVSNAENVSIWWRHHGICPIFRHLVSDWMPKYDLHKLCMLRYPYCIITDNFSLIITSQILLPENGICYSVREHFSMEHVQGHPILQAICLSVHEHYHFGTYSPTARLVFHNKLWQ